jgi:hypothetical protein
MFYKLEKTLESSRAFPLGELKTLIQKILIDLWEI